MLVEGRAFNHVFVDRRRLSQRVPEALDGVGVVGLRRFDTGRSTAVGGLQMLVFGVQLNPVASD